MSLVIVGEPFWALAPETAVSVHAGSSLAQSPHDLALVDVGAVGWKPSLGAVANPGWALLARGAPSLSDGGAAVELGAHHGGDLVCAGVVGPCEEAWSFAVVWKFYL